VDAVIPEGKIQEIKNAIAALREEGADKLGNATVLLSVHRKWLTTYDKQLALVDRGIGAIREKQNVMDKAAGEINIDDTGKDWLAKLKQLTGRPPAPAAGARGSTAQGWVRGTLFAAAGQSVLRDAPRGGGSVSGFVGGSVESALGEGAPPLKLAVVGLRALDWETLWAKEHKFDSSKAAAEEMKVWKNWRDQVSGGEEGAARAPADNFVSNNLHSNEIQKDIQGQYGDLEKNIPGFLTRVESLIKITRDVVLGTGVSEAYFSDGAGAAPVHPAPPAVAVSSPAVPSVPAAGTADITDARKAAIDRANADLKKAGEDRASAERRNRELQGFKPKSGAVKEEMDRLKARGNGAVAEIKKSEGNIKALTEELKGCRDQACLNAKKALISDEKETIRDRRADLDAAHRDADKIRKKGQTAAAAQEVEPAAPAPAPVAQSPAPSAHTSASAAQSPALPGNIFLQDPDLKQRIMLSKMSKPNSAAVIYEGEYEAPFTVGKIYTTRFIYTYSATCTYRDSLWQVTNATRTKTKYLLTVGLKDWEQVGKVEKDRDYGPWKGSSCGK